MNCPPTDGRRNSHKDQMVSKQNPWSLGGGTQWGQGRRCGCPRLGLLQGSETVPPPWQESRQSLGSPDPLHRICQQGRHTRDGLCRWRESRQAERLGGPQSCHDPGKIGKQGSSFLSVTTPCGFCKILKLFDDPSSDKNGGISILP